MAAVLLCFALGFFPSSSFLQPLNATKSCSARGGCACDCSWAPADCGGDDGSCCYACCCEASPMPGPPAPGPGPSTCAAFTTMPGQDCSGDDVSNAPAADVAACCDLCGASSACTAFTWDEYSSSGAKTGTCYLKASCPSTTPNGATTAGRAAGPPSPTPPTPTPPTPTPPSPTPPTPNGSMTLYCPSKVHSFVFSMNFYD